MDTFTCRCLKNEKKKIQSHAITLQVSKKCENNIEKFNVKSLKTHGRIRVLIQLIQG